MPGIAPDLQALLDDPVMRGQALRALAAYDDPATPEIILRHYAKLSESERDDAIATLAARPAWALALLASIGHGHVPRRDINVTTARQLQALGDRRINDQLETGLGQNPTHVEGKGRPDRQVQGAARLGSVIRRATSREVGRSSTAPASPATGSMTRAATSARI